MASYPISTPVTFTITPGAIDFGAKDTAGNNTIVNFVGVNTGDTIYYNGTQLKALANVSNGVYVGGLTAPQWLAIGSTGQVLTVVGGTPTWQSPSPGSAAQTFLASTSASPGTI